ncbi:DUF1508 domain-containing protein [Pasteurellaceae bacterium LIM206]|nr:DUF1508 domain-containing protein [Pasteurellaceae bacterium LIM206]
MYFEVYQGANNQWYWRLKSANHQVVATGGEGYVSKQSCLHGIELVKGTSSSTPVKEV